MNRIGYGAFALALFSASLNAQPFPPPEFGTVQGEEKPALDAEEVADGESRAISGAHIEATEANKSAVLAKNGATIELSSSEIKKTGETSNGGQSNFYGLNAAVVADEKSSVSMNSVSIESDAEGANAVFATGNGAKITAKNLKIATKKNSSRGLDATYGGEITAENVDISTLGAHSAAFATDRGEGVVKVLGGSAKTAGDGSPVIYSTGNISVKNLSGKATGAEIAVIEGKNSIRIEDSNLEGAGPNGIMLYQSFSGDADIGESSIFVKNSTLKSSSSGAFFYITNTKSKIEIESTNLSFKSGVLLRASGNSGERGWGRRGANGGNVDFFSQNQALEGDIECDEISAVYLHLGNGVRFSGAINAANKGAVNLEIAKNALVSLTADSYVDVISSENGKFKNIVSNGFNLYYNKNAPANKKLKGKTFKLAGGGKLIAIEVTRKASPARENSGNPDMPPKDMPPLMRLTGTVKISGGAVVFTSADGKELTLEVPEFPKGDKPPMQHKDGEPKAGGEPKAPPMPHADGKMGGNGDMKEMPKPVSLDDLKALSGLEIEIYGFMSKDKEGVFVVFQAVKK